MEHARTTLSGKVERSHRTDQEEVYPLRDYVDNVDLNKKLAEWERALLHGSPGTAPYQTCAVGLR